MNHRLRAAIAQSTTPHRIVLVADTVEDGDRVVETLLGDLVTKRHAQPSRTLWWLGVHTLRVVSPRARDRVRGMTATAVVIASIAAYGRVVDTLMPAVLSAPGGALWFDLDAELPGPPACTTVPGSVA